MAYKKAVILITKEEIYQWLKDMEKDAGLKLAFLVDTFELSKMDDEEIKWLTRDDLEEVFDRYLERALDEALKSFLDKVDAYLVLIFFNKEWRGLWIADDLMYFVNFDNIYDIAWKELKKKKERLVRR